MSSFHCDYTINKEVALIRPSPETALNDTNISTDSLKYNILNLEVEPPTMTVFLDSTDNQLVCTAKGTRPTLLTWRYSNGDVVGAGESSNVNSESVVMGSYSDLSYSQTATITLGVAKEDVSYTCKVEWGEEELSRVSNVTVICK